jgi:hypothetical protein
MKRTLHAVGLPLLLLLLLVFPASAQFSNCASISSPSARLECYDRQRATGTSPQQFAPSPAPQRLAPAPAPQSAGACTRTSPCVGPRGGLYYFTATGRKQYVSR